MMSANIETLVRYVTDTDGKIDESGLAWIDEHEPNEQILTDLKDSLHQALLGETLPVSQLWENLTI